MKYSCLIRSSLARLFLALAIASPAPGFAETRQEMDSWTYHQEADNWTNASFSFVRSPLPQRGVNDTLRLEIICKDHNLQFALDAYSLLTSRGSSFDFDYQIDQKRPVSITMKTYPDSKRRGYTDENVVGIVEDMLSGKAIFIRAHTLIKTVLSSKIPLDGAAEPIQKVLADCGVTLSNGETQQPGYNLADFERDIKALSPKQRQQVLNKIKKIIEEID
ncbi:hypothetical protein Q9L42_016270 [Methylomarinum sp. Ch1-1]|uniref:Secreted protein n=1 Tax=Methylomarinum roseum TaxID=3067653 RepID=A0AAU7NSF5_9GAMM|nr:hypothetical protein [Methylomarinum sp. Ch1-1]MDP4520110.1 hypothetical protein [Methylomarinum sp. Ch1-1]